MKTVGIRAPSRLPPCLQGAQGAEQPENLPATRHNPNLAALPSPLLPPPRLLRPYMQDAEEAEYLENLFDALCSCLMEPANRAAFVVAEVRPSRVAAA